MKNPSRFLGFLVVVVFSSAPSVFAQAEKVSIRMAPRPGQTVRLSMTQDMDMNMSADTPGFPAVKLQIRTSVVMSHKIGQANPDGTVDAEVTYDEIRGEMSVNGQSTPAAGPANDLLGKTVTVTYNRAGEVIDVKGLPDAAGMGDAVKQMMMSLVGNMPVTPLAVGESVTTPLTMALPLPLPGADGLTMTGETKLTLLAIDTDAQGRSARFASTTNGKMRSAPSSPDGKSTMMLDFTTSGEGTSVLDLDKGIIRSSVVTTTIGGTITMGGATPAQPPMNIAGTMRVMITGTN